MVLYQQPLSFPKTSKRKSKIKSKKPNARSYRKPASPFQPVGVSSSEPVWYKEAVALVDAAVPPESHTACSLTAVWPLSAESWETSSLMMVEDPTSPMPLLLLPFILRDITHFSLLDSCAFDSFISADVVKPAGLRPVPLQEPIRVFRRLTTTHLPIVSGYPFRHVTDPRSSGDKCLNNKYAIVGSHPPEWVYAGMSRVRSATISHISSLRP